MKTRSLKKVITGAILSSLLFSTAVYGGNGLTAKLTNVKLFLNGEKVDQEVVSVNNSSYLPVRAISEALDLKVDWKGEEQTIYLTSNEGVASADDSITEEIVGEWKGVYSANQGETNLIINLFRNDIGKYKAEFIFSATKYNPDVPSGKYIMDVEYNETTKAIKFTGVEWVNRPSNYSMVDLVGSVSGDYINGAVISGSSYSGDFSIKKK